MAQKNNAFIKTNNIWAIQISNSNYRAWNNQETFNDVTFDWSEAKVSNKGSNKRISIRVAKKFPNHNIDSIQTLADGIYYYSRIKGNDLILGVKGPKQISRFGFVKNNNTVSDNPFSRRIAIHWFRKFKPFYAEIDLFKESSEIQKIPLSRTKYIDLERLYDIDRSEFLNFINLEKFPEGDRMYIHNSLMNIKGTNDLNRNENVMNLLIDNDEQKKDLGGKVQLFFGTNRNKTETNTLNDRFGDKLEDLKYGTCTVSIPRGHIQGELEKPKKFLWIFPRKEDAEVHVVTESIEELDETSFYKQFSDGVNEADQKDALVFIHGYNTTFIQAAERTAQIVYDIPYEGVPAFFSWPSSGKALHYLKDIENAEASKNQFCYFIEKIISLNNIKRLHFIAHSLGNRLLGMSLTDLHNKPALTQKLDIISQIVLGAPDIDQNVFKNNILPVLQNVGKRRTLYSSDKDEALHLSEFIRVGLPRLGDAGNDLFVDNGMDTIDASNVKTSPRGHSYIYDTKELLTDLYYLLRNDFAPVDRRLKPRKWDDKLFYWLFAE